MAVLKVLFSFLSLAVLGGLLGVGLALAAKFFGVKKDERAELVEKALPGANCGACGYAGCANYAEAIVKDNVPLDRCIPGGGKVAREVGRIMGKEVNASDEKLVAQVHCRGNKKTTATSFAYSGIRDCNALHILYEGDKGCKYGCLGLGSCMKVCPVDAIHYDSAGCVWVDKEACISCRKCVEVCPTGVMKMIPYSGDYLVACNSKDKGAVTKKYCSVGCIGCTLCVKKSPEGGFIVEENLARIDYTARGERVAASQSCPPKCIILNTTEVVKKDS
jgi:Na+-translocating ferredoxin:NAD+ oxidoreductase RNF subunit RnfB